MEDTNKELERLQQELLAEESNDLDELLADFLEEPLPAFDDPEKIYDPKEPMVYCNYSNDYGKDLQEFAENGDDMKKKKKDDKTLIGLMLTASVLCLGILGILIYWLEEFL